MKLRTIILALALAAVLVLPASAATLRFAFQGELKSLDPYSLNESFTLGMLGNVYEGLTKRDKDLKIIPGEFVFHLARGELKRGEEIVHLTDRERDMLRVLAATPGETVPRIGAP